LLSRRSLRTASTTLSLHWVKMFNAGVGPPSAAFFFLLRAENQQYSRSRAHGGGYLDERGGESAWEGPDTR